MNKKPPGRPLRVGLISLGCAKNLADAEIMLGRLLQDGLEVTNDAGRADVVIVNTCSFIDSAQEESVDAILESDELRRIRNRGQGLIVSGCLPQRFRDELPKLLPEVDAFMGIDQVGQVTEIVRGALANRRAKLASQTESPGRKPPGKSHTAISTQSPMDLESFRGTHHASRITEHGTRNTHPALRTPHSSPRQSEATAGALLAAAKRSDGGRTPRPSPLLHVSPRPNYIPDYATPRFRLTPRHFAYLKIAEGCNHPCTFCIIPRMRGSHRSRPQADLVAEARALLADGVKELNLISQDSTYYGLDLRPNHRPALASPDQFKAAVRLLPSQSTTICTLLRELNALPGDFWIRLLYTHPAHWTDELIQTIADCPKVARYVDIPLQHIHQNMLERMRRETSQQYLVELLSRIRAGVPGIALRTTFIVGFPGETEASFETLLDFIHQTRFERLGVFTYSEQEGTRAGLMAGQIPEAIKKKRRRLAMAAQRKVARQVEESFVGRTLKVLVETQAGAKELMSARIHSWEHGLIRSADLHTAQLHGRYLLARGEADAPDIDGRIYVRGRLPLGEFARVRVIGHTDYDLIAVPV